MIRIYSFQGNKLQRNVSIGYPVVDHHECGTDEEVIASTTRAAMDPTCTNVDHGAKQMRTKCNDRITFRVGVRYGRGAENVERIRVGCQSGSSHTPEPVLALHS